jgi:hypothetical protein
MLQKCAILARSAGSVSSWYTSTVTGSSDGLNWSRQRKRAPIRSLAMSRGSHVTTLCGWWPPGAAAWACRCARYGSVAL